MLGDGQSDVSYARGNAPRSPEPSLLHRVVREQLETFLARARSRGHPAPRFVEQELGAYLRCGGGSRRLPRVRRPGQVLLLRCVLPRRRQNIQIHGGMGFTWEHPAHLYFKRAKSSGLLYGEAAHHREVLAESLGL